MKEVVKGDPDLLDILESWVLPWIDSDCACYLSIMLHRAVSTVLATCTDNAVGPVCSDIQIMT